MKLSSTAFEDNGKIPKIYSRFGGNQRPPLAIANVPTSAQSLVLICHDPDAPGRTGFYHWTVWNIPATTTELTSTNLPDGATEGITSWGTPGWGGPQPPFGTHRYQFSLYALDRYLDLPQQTDPQTLLSIIQPYCVEQTMLTGLFGVFDIFRR